jgi:hypothetical protein
VSTKTQIKARARRAAAQLKMGEIAAIAYSLKNEIEFKVDPKTGDRVRVNGAKGFDEAKAFCVGHRAYDLAEIREELGDNWVRYMVQQGYAVEHRPNGVFAGIFVLTEKAAKTYDLPKYINGGMNANYARVA